MRLKMAKDFEDYLFLIIGSTLNRQDVCNIRQDRQKTSEYITLACMFADALQGMVCAMSNKEKFEQMLEEIKESSGMTVKEFLERFKSSTID
jgi:hypothetical protein